MAFPAAPSNLFSENLSTAMGASVNSNGNSKEDLTAEAAAILAAAHAFGKHGNPSVSNNSLPVTNRCFCSDLGYHSNITKLKIKKDKLSIFEANTTCPCLLSKSSNGCSCLRGEVG